MRDDSKSKGADQDEQSPDVSKKAGQASIAVLQQMPPLTGRFIYRRLAGQTIIVTRLQQEREFNGRQDEQDEKKPSSGICW